MFLSSIQGLDGSSEISGLLSNVQDIDALTDHVINVVRAKMREHSSIRVNKNQNEYFKLCYLSRIQQHLFDPLLSYLWIQQMHRECIQ